jgi:hypothetical protein
MPFVATAKFPSAVAGVADLLNWKNKVPSQSAITLASGIGASDTSISVASGTGAELPTDNFVISIDDEIIFVSSRSTDTLTVGTRGYEGSTAASHSSGAIVEARVTALAHNQLAVEISAIETALGTPSGSGGSILNSVGARVYNTTDISVANNSPETLLFNAERFNYGGVHSVTSNTSRLTAPTAGLYSIFGNVHWNSPGNSLNGAVEIHIRLNGTTNIADTSHNSGNNPGSLYQNVSTIYYLSQGSYVELVALQSTGNGQTIDAVGNLSPEFGMVFLGPIITGGINAAKTVSPVGGRQGDGSTGYVTMAANLVYSGGALSLSFWFKPQWTPRTGQPSNTIELAFAEPALPGPNYFFVAAFNWDSQGVVSGANFWTSFWNGSAEQDFAEVCIPSTYWAGMVGVWNHICITSTDGRHWTVYLNGTSVYVRDVGFGGVQTGTTGFLRALAGVVVNTVQYFSPHSVAECALWIGKCLTAAEVTDLASGRKASNVEASYLRVYWKFDGTSPETDHSGNSNSGTVTDTTSVSGPAIES